MSLLDLAMKQCGVNPDVRRADWVSTIADPSGNVGFVTRVAKDGRWADVRWIDERLTPPEWVKRMPTGALIVRHTIPQPGGMTVTDMTRECELGSATP